MSMLGWLQCLLTALLYVYAMDVNAARIKFESGVRASTPSLAVDPARGLVLTWQTREGSSATLHYALLDAGGRELRRGEIARGSNWFVNWADFPSLLVLDNNDWLTYWLEKSAPDTYAYDIRMVRSGNGGGRWSAPITPHTDGTASEHGFVSLVSLAGANAQVLWLDGRNSMAGADHENHGSEGPMSLRAAQIGIHGRVLEGQEIDPRTCSCCQTDAVRIGDRTLLVYRDRSATEIRDIALVERAGSDPWSTPQIVHNDGWQISACPVNGPAITANGKTALIVWPTLAKAPLAVHYRLRTGTQFGPRFTLEQGEAVLGRVDASAADDGGFAISWIGAGKAGTAIKLAEIDSDGSLRRIREIAALAAGRDVGFPRIVWYRGAHFVTWTEWISAGKTQIALERL